MGNYRKAKCIELHDANISLSLSSEDYETTVLPGRTDHSDKPAFSVRLGDIAMLADMLNIQISRHVNVPHGYEPVPAYAGKNENINLLDIPIFKNHFDYANSLTTGDETIIALYCDVASDRIVNIKMAIQATEEEIRFQEMTYCGSFTIWWLVD